MLLPVSSVFVPSTLMLFPPVLVPRQLVLVRPHPAAARLALLGVQAAPTLGFGAGPAAIEPGLEFFRAGHTIGGPSGTSYRGVRATSFPFPSDILGSGAPLEAWLLGLAGSPIGF